MTSGTLCIKDMRFRFPGQTADLFSIPSLDLAPGRSVGIRGASGAGKTTLLHCLAGIEPAQGSIRWGNHELGTLSATGLTRWRQDHLGLIFQDFHLVEGLSALDNVLLPASFSAWRTTPALRTRAHGLLERVGIATPQRRAELLSRGERQRVAVARALIFAPNILLADEPTASLDPENRAVIGDLLHVMATEHQATLIVVSHEESLLDRLDICYQLHQGRLMTTEGGHV